MDQMDEIVELAWEQRKVELEDEIDKAIETGGSKKEVLLLMKELLQATKVRSSIEDYYKDTKDWLCLEKKDGLIQKSVF